MAIQKQDPYQQALDSLTRYLAIRDHSRLELQQKLARRFELELVEKLLSEAEARGWLLSETVVAERAVESLRRKKKSARFIEMQLRKRGLPVPPVDEASEEESARALVARKFGGTEMTSAERAKAIKFLEYRGFEERVIRQVLNEE